MQLRFALVPLTLAACKVDPPTPIPDPTMLAIEPGLVHVPTCRSRHLDTTATELGLGPVAWSVDGGGTMDPDGTYHAPIQVPDPASATVTATAGGETATSTVMLATAFPDASQQLGPELRAADRPNMQRQVALRGLRGYAIVQTTTAPFTVAIVRTDDGGVSWKTPSTLATFAGPQALVGSAIAIDAGDPDRVYATLRVDAGDPTSPTIASTGGLTTGSHLALMVSKDGGATWDEHALYGGGNGDVDEPDVASPAPGHVVVTGAVPYGAGADAVLVWHDAQGGDGIGAMTLGDNGHGAYWAPSVREAANGPSETVERNSHGHGPQLTTNAAGTACFTYEEQSGASAEVVAHLECSTDGGATWPTDVAIAHAPAASDLERPRVAISQDGRLVAATWNVHPLSDTEYNMIAISHDGGATFDPPAALPTVPDGQGGTLATVWSEPAFSLRGELWVTAQVLDTSEIVVDKSCDEGTTWSGGLVLDDASGVPMVEPMLVTSVGGTFVSGVRYVSGNSGDSNPMIVRLED